MRDESQKTWISTLRDHVNEWRKREGWSRETVAQVIVEKFEEQSGPETTGIYFEPKTRDPFERQKVNADRIFRWLDDVSKDGNLMPSNFGHYVMAAMPLDIRVACADEEMRKVGIRVSVSDEDASSGIDMSDICETHIVIAETMKALVVAQQNPTPENLDNAERQTINASGRLARMGKKIAGSRIAMKAKALIGKIVHRKDKVNT